MAKTAQELVTRVMQKLTNLPPGEDPSAEDDAFITGVWKTINDELRSRKVSSWTFDAIPNEAFESIAQYVKERVWEEYHGARDGNSEIVEAALRAVRRVTAARYMGSVQQATYY